jgi:glucosamine--fructose-6-phosphate aminotransferase (isomerizing)
MCGIVGYIGNKKAWPIVIEGLRRLEYRGYDSSGVAIVDHSGKLQFRKSTGKVNDLYESVSDDCLNGSIGLGHTRWATHGKPSENNAHPHTGHKGRVAVVHNGIVENFIELKRELVTKGHVFTSETDTEVIAHLIELGLETGNSFEDSFRQAGQRLIGSQAIAATMSGDNLAIYAMRLGYAGGIVVCHNGEEGIISSDLPAMVPIIKEPSMTGEVVYLEPGEMAIVSAQDVVYKNLSGEVIKKKTQRVTPEDVVVDKSGYRHFMLKEIMEQPQSVSNAISERIDFENGRITLSEINLDPSDIVNIKKVMLIGCGTSLHAAQVGRYLVESMSDLPAEAESASEFRYRKHKVDKDTLYVSIAQSGETADTVAAMQEISNQGGRLITICNVEGSQSTRLADATIYMRCGLEIGVASTKTFISSLTILSILSAYLGQERGSLTPKYIREFVDNLASIPRLLGDMLADDEQYRRLARKYHEYKDFLFLGRGINTPVALEGALKLKEISYVHAEGYPAGEMKHGPIALIDKDMATLALAPLDDLYEKMVGNIQEIKARDGVLVGVVTEGDDQLPEILNDVIFIPKLSKELTPILATIPLQLLAYHIAIHKGSDVDQPRNLAKSVTVE